MIAQSYLLHHHGNLRHNVECVKDLYQGKQHLIDVHLSLTTSCQNISWLVTRLQKELSLVFQITLTGLFICIHSPHTITTPTRQIIPFIYKQ